MKALHANSFANSFAQPVVLWFSSSSSQLKTSSHQSHLKVWLIIETCAWYQCAASISYQLTMISHTVYTWMKWLTFDDKQLSQQSFKVLSMVKLITEYLVLELQSLLQQFSICWVFSTMRFYMSLKIERITLFLKILWLNILAVSPAYTQGPYQAQTIHKKKHNSWGGQSWWLMDSGLPTSGLPPSGQFWGGQSWV